MDGDYVAPARSKDSSDKSDMGAAIRHEPPSAAVARVHRTSPTCGNREDSPINAGSTELWS